MVVRTDLARLEPGKTAVVVAVQGGLGVTGRLAAMGIRTGVVLQKIAGHPFGGPVLVQVGNSRIALGFGMAKKVSLETDAQGEVT